MLFKRFTSNIQQKNVYDGRLHTVCYHSPGKGTDKVSIQSQMTEKKWYHPSPVRKLSHMEIRRALFYFSSCLIMPLQLQILYIHGFEWDYHGCGQVRALDRTSVGLSISNVIAEILLQVLISLRHRLSGDTLQRVSSQRWLISPPKWPAMYEQYASVSGHELHKSSYSAMYKTPATCRYRRLERCSIYCRNKESRTDQCSDTNNNHNNNNNNNI